MRNSAPGLDLGGGAVPVELLVGALDVAFGIAGGADAEAVRGS